jgi:tubulin polyglutamylase TTLL6/13
MSNIYRKNNLGRNLNKMRKAMPKDFNFYPKTWLLPLDHRNFLNEFKELKRIKKMLSKSKNPTFKQFYE